MTMNWAMALFGQERCVTNRRGVHLRCAADSRQKRGIFRKALTSAKIMLPFSHIWRTGVQIGSSKHSPTPRAQNMLDLLALRPRTTGELAEHFQKLSRFAVMKHLRVLHGAGLLLITRDGRKRWNRLNPVPLREVLRRWVDRQQEMWADVMLNIRDAAQNQSSDLGAQRGAAPKDQDKP